MNKKNHLHGSYIETKNYDHIFICVRLGDNEHKNDIPVYDWIGLGSMDYLGVGFSNIRLPNSSISYTLHSFFLLTTVHMMF